ncbi:hypothetical protein [Chitinophaga barathri]|uniref:DUF4595 domain-containing protein n=1 Tax=Chitinophaga barathri TaxID=1647451 RepID=A0A3N4MEZ1_9BACT|nr:hypothetical protein [Chitinophaga barathri]RPD42391.1 hypothetical protein EG028_04225 [Chitinophaga barathri]
MKKALLGFALLTILYGCSKNNDDKTTPELPHDTYVVTRVKAENDSMVFKHNEDALITQFADWVGNTADSFEVSYNEKGLSEFKYFTLAGKRTDRKFVYSGNRLAAVEYYNLDNNGQLIVTDKDSLVYVNDKLAEYHEISGGVRGGVYKLTWNGNNVNKAEFFLVNGTTEIPTVVNTYTYNTEKTGYQHAFKADFLLRYEKHNFSHLSTNAVTKDEQKAAGSGVLLYVTNYTTAYNEQGYPAEVKIVKDDKENNQVISRTLRLEYAVLK